MTTDAFHVYDTTLRDGAQREGITYSVADKLAVARLLDEFGVAFIEGGWPGAMPKDTEFFQRAQRELDLKHAELVAFGATRKAGVAVEDDAQVAALLDSGAPVITVVAKSDTRHVAEALRTTPEENLAMVVDTVRFLVSKGRRVFVDYEHFFDGYRNDPDYGVLLIKAATEAGASVNVLCDTNGGCTPSRITAVVTDVLARAAKDVGIRVTFAVFMRDRHPLIYGPSDAALAGLTPEHCAAVEATFLNPMPDAAAQIARVEAIAEAVESDTFSVQFGPNGPQWATDELLGAIARRSEETGRRVHMHLLETRYQRAFADEAYPEGITKRLRAIGLLSPRIA